MAYIMYCGKYVYEKGNIYYSMLIIHSSCHISTTRKIEKWKKQMLIKYVTSSVFSQGATSLCTINKKSGWKKIVS